MKTAPQAVTIQNERLLRLRDVMDRTGLGSSTIYRHIDSDEFPRPFRVGASMVRWKESEIQAWIDSLEVRSS